jgi:hypothetical protein
MYLPSEPKSSFYPLLKPNISPGTNIMPAAKGNPELEERVANCDAVSLRECIAWVVRSGITKQNQYEGVRGYGH